MCDDNIKVVVKVRPLIGREINDKLPQLWNRDHHHIWPKDCNSTKESYTFDAVFDEDSTTKNLYDEVARPIVEAAIEGINGTIFAYGQTSSGKTYTMMGNDHCSGIIPLAVNDIFKLRENKADRDFLIRVSFIEIYNEKIRDLLDINNADVKIREDFNNQVYAMCKEEVTTSPEDVLRIMSRGNQNRSVGETLMNERSSRSHSIFQIIIESRKHMEESSLECDDSVNVSQLNLVDLAGSERTTQAGTTKQRFREGCHINKSLATLCLVIRQLSMSGSRGFVNYRDSKLTRFLQSSLGGNAKTGIICTVTTTSLEETDSTLKFATLAKTVKNKPIVNQIVSNATQLKMLTKQLESLQKEIDAKKCLEEDNQRLQQKVADLKAKILMGIGNRNIEREKYNAQRRRTWCGQGLPTIAEDISHSITPLKLFTNNAQDNKFNLLRLSNITERSDSLISNRDSISSLFTPPDKGRLSEKIIELDDTDEDDLNRSCSPTTHRCFGTPGTPPCTLRERIEFLQKEYKELEEMTSAERLYKPDELEYIKLSEELRSTLQNAKEELQNTKDELQTLKTSEAELKEKISDLVSEKEINESHKIKTDKVIEELQCEIEGLKYQIDNNKNNHKKREEELLMSLEEARKGKLSDTLNENSNKSTRYSQIPILSDNKRKNSFDNCKSNNNIEEDPVFIDKKNELLEQTSLNSKLKQKIEELEYKLTLSNEKITEISNDNEKHVNLLTEIGELKKSILDKDEIIKKHNDMINTCTALIEQTLKQKNHDDAIITSSDLETGLKKLLDDYIDLYKTTGEHKNACDVLKEKLTDLDNINNEMKSKLDHLNDKISGLQTLDFKKVSKITLTDTGLTLDRYLKNLISITHLSIHGMENDEQESYLINDSSESTINEDVSIIKMDVVSSISYLEDMLSVFENNLFQLLGDYNSEIPKDYNTSDTSMSMECMPAFKTLHSKLQNTTNLHKLLVDILEKRKDDLLMKNTTLLDENTALKTEIQDAFHHVRELLIECEDLYKKILHHRNEHQVSNAEITLVTSQLNAANHYHNCLHSTCDSTIQYFRKQLLGLQEYLQNYAKDNDTMDLMDSSYSNLFSPEVSQQSKIDSDALANVSVSVDYNDVINKKQKEIEALQNTVKLLEEENGSLSDQLMEYIQDSDHVKQHIERANIAINTTLTEQKSCIICEDKILLTESDLDNLKNIFTLLEIEIDKSVVDLSNIEVLKTCIEKSFALIKSLLEKQKSDCEQLNDLNDELKQLTETVDVKMTIEQDLQLRLNNIMKKNSDLQTSLNILESESGALKFQLSEITSKYNELLGTSSTITSNIECSEELLKFKKEMSQLTDKLHSLNEKCENKNAELDVALHKNTEYELKLASLTTENDKLNVELQHLTAKLEEIMNLEEESKQLKLNNEEFIRNQNVIEELKFEIASKTELCSGNIILIEELNMKINSLSTEISTKNENETKLNSEINDLKNALGEKIAAHFEELNFAQRKNIELESEIMVLKTENDNVKQEFNVINMKLNEMVNTENELERMKQTEQFENIQLKRDIEKLNGTINVLNEKIINKENIEVDLMNKIADLTEEIAKLKESLSKTESFRSENDVIIRQKDDEIKKLTEIFSCLEERSVEDKSLIDNLKAEIVVANEKLSSYKAENAFKLTEIEALKDQILSLEKSLEEKSKSLSIQNQDFEKRLELCNATIVDKSKEIELLQKSLKSKTEEVNRLKDEMESQHKDQTKQNDLLNKIVDLEKELTISNSEITKKSNELETCKLEAVVLQNNLQDKTEELIQLKDVIEKKKYEEQTRQKYSEELEKKLEFIRTEKDEKSTEIEIYKSKLESLEKTLKSKTEEISKLKNAIENITKNLQQNIEKYKSEMNSMYSENENCKKENARLLEELKNNNNKIFGLENFIKSHNLQNSSKDEEIQQLKNQIISLNTEFGQQHSRELQINAELQFQISNYQSEVNNLKNKLLHMNQTLDEYVKDNNKLKSLETNMKDYQTEINIRDSKLVSLKNQLDEVVKNAQHKIEEVLNINNKLKMEIDEVKNEKDSEILKLQSEIKSTLFQLRSFDAKEKELKENINCIEKERSALQEKVEELQKVVNEKSAIKITGFSDDFMENFVDKMTHEIALDNNRQLQATIMDLRLKNKEFNVKLRKLQQSLQNDTINSLANERSTGELRKQIDELKSNLMLKEKEYKEMKETYDELDKEYNTFLGLYNDMEKCNGEMYLENKKLKASVANYQMELKEYKETSYQEERRKKRQSIHDMNRRGFDVSSNENEEKDSPKKVEVEKENNIFRKNINDLQVLQQLTPKQNHNFLQQACQKCVTLEHLKLEYNRLKARHADLELRFNSHISYQNGGIIMNQKLRDCVLENERLQYANEKLKDLCKLRGQKIKELKNSRKDDEEA